MEKVEFREGPAAISICSVGRIRNNIIWDCEISVLNEDNGLCPYYRYHIQAADINAAMGIARRQANVHTYNASHHTSIGRIN